MTTGFILIGLLLLLIIMWPLLILAHEMGHAIPALILTNQPVTVYIGSYGDSIKSQKLRLARLTIWFKLNLLWRNGSCEYNQENMPVWQQAIILLGGSMMSLLSASVGYYLVFHYNLHGSLKILIILFSFFAIWDLISNLIPRNNPLSSHKSPLYNDGYLLRRLWYYRRFNSYYEQASSAFSKQDYVKASAIFEKLLSYGFTNPETYQFAIYSRGYCKDYPAALALYRAYSASHSLSAELYWMGGWLKAKLGFYQETLEDFNTALETEPNNTLFLSNTAYTLNLLGRYTEAIELFNKVIDLNPSCAYSYSNRGFSKMKLNDLPAGLADINYSLELDDKNSYGHRNLGIYHLEVDNFREATNQFCKAHSLDADTHLITELLKYVSENYQEK